MATFVKIGNRVINADQIVEVYQATWGVRITFALSSAKHEGEGLYSKENRSYEVVLRDEDARTFMDWLKNRAPYCYVAY